MSSGMEAGLEMRGTANIPPATWQAVVPSVDIDEVPNRTIFALLAGYPSTLGLDPLFSRRGLPQDVTREIKERYEGWGGAAHDASWVTYTELRETLACLTAVLEDSARRQTLAADDLLKIRRGVSIVAVSAFLEVYHQHGFETRMVFWFTPV
jgi:hypothetical protein